MNNYIGIDLGTSTVKLLLADAAGAILKSVSENYDVSYPIRGWCEQNPEDWYRAVLKGLNSLLEGCEKKSVRGISFGGQMHGLVALDRNGELVRPCILWNDSRAAEQTAYLNDVIGKDKLYSYTANEAFAGFTAPKLLWMKEHENSEFQAIRKIMLPKDYLAYRLTGNYSTDFSDASGTLLFDVTKREWSREMCSLCGVDMDFLPPVFQSFDIIGTLKEEVADGLGLSRDVTVAAGAGDNAAAAVGTGTVGRGGCNISLGTSGTLFVAGGNLLLKQADGLHTFCHADGGFHLMGCILSAASCNAWWSDNILQNRNYFAQQQGIESMLGSNNVYFLPYLSGERSPLNDVNAKGAFIGMTHTTTRKQMTQAVLEGVAFALKSCLNSARQSGVSVNRATLCGGGAKSALWRKIVANVMNMPIDIPKTEQGPAFGAAIFAMVACGEYSAIDDAVKKIVDIKETVYPDSSADAYVRKYSVFESIYPALKNVFFEINNI